MKGKIFMLGLLLVSFAISSPAYAATDPCGGVTIANASVMLSTVPVLSTASDVFAIEAAPIIGLLAALAVVTILFVPAVRRRVLSIPWRGTSFATKLKNMRLKVRLNFDKLTKSPFLKHQFAA